MKKVIMLLSVFILLSCSQRVDHEAEKVEILNILAAADRELLEGNLKTDTTTVKSLNLLEGKMELITASEADRRNQTLLDKAKFVRIENLDGPVIGISPDGNMAWAAVRTKFVLAYADSLGANREWEGIESRLEVYEKISGNWNAVACAQTH